MFYREYTPPPDLRDTVRCFWALQDPDGAGSEERILPDGCMEVVVHRGAPMVRVRVDGRREVQPRAVLAGQLRKATTLVATGGVDMVGVRFEPWGCAHVLGASLAELTDDIVPLDDIDVGITPDVLERVRDEPEIERAVGHLVGHVRRAVQTRRRAEGSGTLRDAARMIALRHGQVRVDELAAQLGWSRRRLERQFERHVGLSPKSLCRVTRLQELVTRLGSGPLAHVALGLGYSDQAHLARDFRDLAGQTISEYLAETHALSDCFTTSS